MPRPVAVRATRELEKEQPSRVDHVFHLGLWDLGKSRLAIHREENRWTVADGDRRLIVANRHPGVDSAFWTTATNRCSEIVTVGGFPPAGVSEKAIRQLRSVKPFQSSTSKRFIYLFLFLPRPGSLGVIVDGCRTAPNGQPIASMDPAYRGPAFAVIGAMRESDDAGNVTGLFFCCAGLRTYAPTAQPILPWNDRPHPVCGGASSSLGPGYPSSGQRGCAVFLERSSLRTALGRFVASAANILNLS